MRRYRLSTGSLLLVALLAVGACGDAETNGVGAAPEPGYLTLTLVTPHPNDGAIHVIIRGDGVTEPRSVGEEVLLFSSPGETGDGELRLAIVGNGLAGALARIWVPDVTSPDAYSVELIEVADERNGLRADLEGYQVSLSP